MRKQHDETTEQEEREANEEITNDLIAIIWPLLDKGMSKSDVKCLISNVMDAWEPVQKA